jgi:hypothetical protein
MLDLQSAETESIAFSGKAPADDSKIRTPNVSALKEE